MEREVETGFRLFHVYADKIVIGILRHCRGIADPAKLPRDGSPRGTAAGSL